jgi:hypothetical protein
MDHAQNELVAFNGAKGVGFKINKCWGFCKVNFCIVCDCLKNSYCFLFLFFEALKQWLQVA